MKKKLYPRFSGLLLALIACTMTFTVNAQTFPTHLTFQTAQLRTIVSTEGRLVGSTFGTEISTEMISLLANGIYIVTEQGTSERIRIFVRDGRILGNNAVTDVPPAQQISPAMESFAKFAKELKGEKFQFNCFTGDIIEEPVKQWRSSNDTMLSGRYTLVELKDLSGPYPFVFSNTVTQEHIAAFGNYGTPDAGYQFRIIQQPFGDADMMLGSEFFSSHRFQDPRSWDTLTTGYHYDQATQTNLIENLPIDVYKVMDSVTIPNSDGTFTDTFMPCTIFHIIASPAIAGDSINLKFTLTKKYRPNPYQVSCNPKPRFHPRDAKDMWKQAGNKCGIATWQDSCESVNFCSFTGSAANNGNPDQLTQTATHPRLHDSGYPTDLLIADLDSMDVGGVCDMFQEVGVRFGQYAKIPCGSYTITGNPNNGSDGHAMMYLVRIVLRVNVLTGTTAYDTLIYVLDPTNNTFITDLNGNIVDLATIARHVLQGTFRDSLTFYESTTLGQALSEGPCEFVNPLINVPTSFVSRPEPGATLYRYHGARTYRDFLKGDRRIYQTISRRWESLEQRGLVLNDDPRDWVLSPFWVTSITGPKEYTDIIIRIIATVRPEPIANHP